jgi:hypothetical protein
LNENNNVHQIDDDNDNMYKKSLRWRFFAKISQKNNVFETKVKTGDINEGNTQNEVKLIKIKNNWSNNYEWNGDWNDE